MSSGSGALGALPVTWVARTERPDGKTSPEELIAAAHASCFAMALSLMLGENHTPPERLVVSAACTLDEVDGAPKLTSSELRIRARVDGIEAADFEEQIQRASELCVATSRSPCTANSRGEARCRSRPLGSTRGRSIARGRAAARSWA
jgi:osmotically inducible protein OsmC